MRRLLTIITLVGVISVGIQAQEVEITEKVNLPEGQNWDYVALGDSITFGVGASTTSANFVSLYRNILQNDHNVTVNLMNRGISGQTSAQLLNAIQTNQTLRTEVQNAEVITFNIGGNDLLGARAFYKQNACGGTDGQNCLRTAVASFKTNWTAVVAQILALRANSSVLIKTMDMYNPLVNIDQNADTFPNDGGLTDLQAFKPYLDDANLHMRNSAAANNIPLSRIYLEFNQVSGIDDPVSEGLIAADNVHPNDNGHFVIANEFRTSTAPTNVTVQVGGRVFTPFLAPLGRASVTFVDIYGRRLSARTNPFGYYGSPEAVLGETYLIRASHKEYSFSNRTVTVNGPISTIVLVANQ